MQKRDGSFSAFIDGSEDDMRFVFCAAAICFILDNWGDVDKERMYQFIMSSMVSHSHLQFDGICSANILLFYLIFF